MSVHQPSTTPLAWPYMIHAWKVPHNTYHTRPYPQHTGHACANATGLSHSSRDRPRLRNTQVISVRSRVGHAARLRHSHIVAASWMMPVYVGCPGALSRWIKRFLENLPQLPCRPMHGAFQYGFIPSAIHVPIARACAAYIITVLMSIRISRIIREPDSGHQSLSSAVSA